LEEDEGPARLRSGTDRTDSVLRDFRVGPNKEKNDPVCPWPRE
jgi:hypothetical protein